MVFQLVGACSDERPGEPSQRARRVELADLIGFGLLFSLAELDQAQAQATVGEVDAMVDATADPMPIEVWDALHIDPAATLSDAYDWGLL